MENEKMEPELIDHEKITTGAMIADLLFLDLFRDDVYNRFQLAFVEALADEMRRAEARLRLAAGVMMSRQMRGETGGDRGRQGETGEGVEQYAFIPA
jgi:hypothetical protein